MRPLLVLVCFTTISFASAVQTRWTSWALDSILPFSFPGRLWIAKEYTVPAEIAFTDREAGERRIVRGVVSTSYFRPEYLLTLAGCGLSLAAYSYGYSPYPTNIAEWGLGIGSFAPLALHALRQQWSLGGRLGFSPDRESDLPSWKLRRVGKQLGIVPKFPERRWRTLLKRVLGDLPLYVGEGRMEMQKIRLMLDDRQNVESITFDGRDSDGELHLAIPIRSVQTKLAKP